LNGGFTGCVNFADEILIQHLLTERQCAATSWPTAAEVEKVIAALVSRHFSRAEFLKSFDKY
jgi:hypothetical protein